MKIAFTPRHQIKGERASFYGHRQIVRVHPPSTISRKRWGRFSSRNIQVALELRPLLWLWLVWCCWQPFYPFNNTEPCFLIVVYDCSVLIGKCWVTGGVLYRARGYIILPYVVRVFHYSFLVIIWINSETLFNLIYTTHLHVPLHCSRNDVFSFSFHYFYVLYQPTWGWLIKHQPAWRVWLNTIPFFLCCLCFSSISHTIPFLHCFYVPIN